MTRYNRYNLVLIGLISGIIVCSFFVLGSYSYGGNEPMPFGSTLYVGGTGEGNYTHIQDAIDSATTGDTIFVYNGTYNENININTQVFLEGQDWENTIIDGGNTGDVVTIAADNTEISGFSIKNSGSGGENAGIRIYYVNGVLISKCKIVDNNIGINLLSSDSNIIKENRVVNSTSYGINMGSLCDYNLIFHNNFVSNSPNAYDGGYDNDWYNATLQEGNYWDDYTGSDIDGNGIGDTPYEIPGGTNQDLYPLMNLWGEKSPVAIFTYIVKNRTATFNASLSYDPDGTIVFYKWDFGDGQNGTGMTINHTYTTNGTYDVTLTVIDDDGKNDTSCENIYIGVVVSIEDCSAPPSDTVTVPIIIHNVRNIMTADVNLTYNQSVVNIMDVDDGDFDATTWVINNASGWTRIGTYQIMNDPLSGDVILANVTLQAVGNTGESSPLNLTNIYLENGTEIEIPATSDNGTFTIEDAIPPEITDNTPSIAHTGDSFTFNATVTDDIQVSTVWIEYWYGTGSHTNVSMNNVADDYWEKPIIIEDTLDKLHYIISANDTSNNWNNTGIRDVNISDTDKPEITDNTPSDATTGDPFTFNATVTDNVGVSNVSVYYWFGTEEAENKSMVATGIDDYYEYEITMPFDSIATLHYNISAVDDAGNWNQTGVKNVTITDNDEPVYTWISKPIEGTTGGSALVSLIVTDNIGVTSYEINVSGTVYDMTKDGDYYNYTINIPSDSITNIPYNCTFKDAEGNVNKTEDVTIEVTDDIKPTSFVDDISPYWQTSIPFTITATASDNIGLKNVSLYYLYSTDNLTWGNWILFGVDDETPWEWSFTGSDGYYQFYSIAIDNAGNVEGPPPTADAMAGIDTTPPEITNSSASPQIIPEDTDGDPRWGEKSNLSIVVTDESNITNVTIDLSQIGGPAVQSMIHLPDTNIWYIETNASIGSANWDDVNDTYVPYMLEVNATDEYGNWNTSYINLTVWKNGDVSGNGKVTLYDASYLAKWYIGDPDFPMIIEGVADVSGNGKITLYDASYLAKWYIGDPDFSILQ